MWPGRRTCARASCGRATTRSRSSPARAGTATPATSTSTGLLVDFDDLRKVAVDRGTGVVTVQPGARNTDIYDGLQPYGVAFSAGRCPTVAISGLALGGGFGFSSRHLGLTSDALLETQVVTAGGDILTCSEKENADLFWACRGGGGRNFGINTSYRLRSWPVDDVSLYDFTWEWKQASEVIAALQQVVREAPNEWSMRIGIGASGRPGSVTNSIGALGQFFGAKSELVALLDPVLPSVTKPTKQPHRRAHLLAGEELFLRHDPVRLLRGEVGLREAGRSRTR